MPHWIPKELLEPAAVTSIEQSGATLDSVVGGAVLDLSLAISAKRQADALEKLLELREESMKPTLEMAPKGPSLFEQQRESLVECSKREAKALEEIAQALHPDSGLTQILQAIEMNGRSYSR